MPTNIYPSLKSLCSTAAKMIGDISAEAIAERGLFTIALSGGSTPQHLYRLLASPEWQNRIDWKNWHFFWSDERLVPLDDMRSNYHAASSALLSKLHLSPEQVHSVAVGTGASEEIARQYEDSIRSVITEKANSIPRFDLILLGLGSDGHTASLFPGNRAVEESKKLVVSSPPGILPPPVERVTFTLPLINAASNVMVLVTGESKRKAFQSATHKQTLSGIGTPPAAKIKPESGKLFWLVDTDVAGPA